jgi:beta-lactamase class A
MMNGIYLSRRELVLGAGAALICGAALARRSAAASEVAAIERQLGGRVGIAALDTGNGRRFSHRGGERFAMCSTFKWILAAMVLHQSDRGQMSLDRSISFGAADLLPYAPVSRAHVSEGHLTVSELCSAAVEFSDNTAANLLLGLIGGPPGLTAYLRDLGDAVIRLDRNEPDLNDNLPGGIRDTATPEAMIGIMRKILIADALSPASRSLLVDWMKNCKTGLGRLRAGMPQDWPVGDKTGTGDNGAVNDVAIIWPPDRAPILVAAFMSGSPASEEAHNAAHAKLGRIVAAAFAQG